MPAGFQIKRVAIIFAQMSFNRARGVIPISCPGFLNYFSSECADARIEIGRELQITRGLDRVLQWLRTQGRRIWFNGVGEDFVSDSLLIVRPRLDSSLGIDTHKRQAPLDADNPGRAK